MQREPEQPPPYIALVELLKKSWVQFALGAVLFFVLGFVVTFVATKEPPILPERPDRLVLNADAAGLAEQIPLFGTAAIAEGWGDTFLCIKRGRGALSVAEGKYFDKSEQDIPYRLIYSRSDVLLGVYLYSETPMPEPWGYEEYGFEQVSSLAFEHWSLPVYVNDPTKACGEHVQLPPR